jgi:hypothetical protein
MSVLPVQNDRVQLTTESGAVWMNGLLMNGDKAVYATSSPVNYSNGIQRTASGAIYCVDATAGLPAGTTWTNGLPFNTLGALCIANNAVVTWSNGIPFDANGAVCAAFLPDIASLFANGEEGWWYDPSNFATLFQDSAGTTPVTAVEQPVGLQLDLSGRGNHRFQTTSANRPVVSARVNLLTKTEDFANAVWAAANAGGGSIVPTKGTTTGTKPDGSVGTIDTVTFPSVSSGQASFIFQNTGASQLNIGVTESIYVRVASGSATVFLNVEDVAVSPSGGNFVAGTAQTVTTEWTSISLSGTRTASSGNAIFVLGFDSRANAVQTNAAPITIQVWGADFRVSNIGVNLPAYQRVNTSTDYDSTGFPVYIKPNGSNQFMQTNSINFSATDKMTVWQGVRKLSDAAAFGVVSEFSSNWNTNTGSFVVFAPNEFAGTYGVASRGTTGVGLSQVANASGYAAPITNVLASFNDISGDLTTLRINGVAQTSGTGDKGAGNFGNYPAYFYMRAGTSLPFNGHDYGSIARGAASTAAQIAAGEEWINSKTKAY